MASLSQDQSTMNPPADSQEYWFQAKQPFACLIFLLPFLLTYEVGVVWLGTTGHPEVRNGADHWLRGSLQQVGFEHTWLLPVLILAGLLAWQIAGKYPWRISAETLMGMFAESILFAFCLVVIGQCQDWLFQNWIPLQIGAGGSQAVLARVISFVGAGIYEEVLFRLCLLPVGYWIFRGLRLSANWAAVLAVISTSLTFSLVHYVGPFADTFSVFSFTFRTLAGVFFSTLFFLRGLGITVGCHAVYDLLVGVLMAVE